MRDSNHANEKPEPLTLISIIEVSEMLGVTRPTVRNMWQRGDIPAPIILGEQIHRWYKHEIQEVLNKAIAARGKK